MKTTKKDNKPYFTAQEHLDEDQIKGLIKRIKKKIDHDSLNDLDFKNDEVILHHW